MLRSISKLWGIRGVSPEVVGFLQGLCLVMSFPALLIV